MGLRTDVVGPQRTAKRFHSISLDNVFYQEFAQPARCMQAQVSSNSHYR